MTTTEKIEIMNHYVNNGLVGYKDKELNHEGVLSPYNEPIWDWNTCDYFIINENVYNKIEQIIKNYNYDKILDFVDDFLIDSMQEDIDINKRKKEKLIFESENLLNELIKKENITKKELLLKSEHFIVYKNDIDISLSFLYNTETTNM